jgi:zinc-ribbon domain
MAFCNSCGATLTEGAGFCSKCGTPIAGAPVAPRMSTASTGAAPAIPAPTGNSGLKTLLLVVGAIALIGIFSIVALTFVGLHIARRTRVTQDGEHVRVETPFGRVEASKDPEQAAKNLGVDIYPGAGLENDGASTATVAGIRTTTANFESSDAPDKVCAFYRSKFPDSRVSTSDRNRCTIVSEERGNMVTVNVESNGDGSRFQITSVLKNAGSSSQ